MSIHTKYLFVIFSAITLSLLVAVVLTIDTVNAFENITEYKFVKKMGRSRNS
jgi:hypothetical protein